MTKEEQLKIAFKYTLVDMTKEFVGPLAQGRHEVEIRNIVDNTVNLLLKEVSIRTDLR